MRLQSTTSINYSTSLLSLAFVLLSVASPIAVDGRFIRRAALTTTTTGPKVALLDLGSAARYTIFAGTGISATSYGDAPAAVVHGDIGSGSPASNFFSSYNGFGTAAFSSGESVLGFGHIYDSTTTGPAGTLADVTKAHTVGLSFVPLAADSDLSYDHFDNIKVLSRPGVFHDAIVIGKDLVINGKCGDIYVFQAPKGDILIGEFGKGVQITLTGGIGPQSIYFIARDAILIYAGATFPAIGISGTSSQFTTATITGAIYAMTSISLNGAIILKPSKGLSLTYSSSICTAPNCAIGEIYSNGNCVACGLGQFSPGGTSTTCFCLPGKAYFKNKVCTYCGVGVEFCSFLDGSILLCSAGYQYDTSLKICKICAVGTASLGGVTLDPHSKCTACLTGFYASSTGSKLCSTCPISIGRFGTCAVATGLDVNCKATYGLDTGTGVKGTVCTSCISGYSTVNGAVTCTKKK